MALECERVRDWSGGGSEGIGGGIGGRMSGGIESWWGGSRALVMLQGCIRAVDGKCLSSGAEQTYHRPWHAGLPVLNSQSF